MALVSVCVPGSWQHTCAWLNSRTIQLGVCTLVEKAAVGWLATNRRQDDTDVDDVVERTIQEGELAKAAALHGVCRLVGDYNERLHT